MTEPRPPGMPDEPSGRSLATESPVPDFFERGRGILAQWTGVSMGAAAWFLHLNISYALVRYVCATGSVWLLHLATLGSAALATAGLLVAYGSWKHLSTHAETDPHLLTGADDPEDATHGRARLMALGGIALSAFFLLIIVTAWVPDLILSPCENVVR